ncbi:MAG: hypothetical protein KJO40_13445 [Deltaproteobacteria bacterium]|nr:hypothetical protein [Deltaproteobacteria bacterium]
MNIKRNFGSMVRQRTIFKLVESGKTQTEAEALADANLDAFLAHVTSRISELIASEEEGEEDIRMFEDAWHFAVKSELDAMIAAL